ncbi:prepilin-type N-terminal cleavage/methylation domain-containing protein [Anabaena aphanizomenioides LEGE 00250]|uniref:Prepilin-type N-terminal cleavage/methylation domain-containing protein n=1 Tax=Sphaerospermopsis aphanizomenoides LEGE 00250 TaxID=2777972 RepID=A0ABR9VDG7_9CYAN|nr:prepilin-type N-terminal cleavage/methylation domain-containing protein [Sphaerospermopsis aphanizomenoides]MBE9235757.1 prepilin-type N-terminal cleavage/methylation domain-containing protein [Sphaerospermopsis aphanizomenoides LEGE 00250]
MKNYLKFIKSNHAADKGFTLIEILVAAVIMSMVVTLAGTAFVALLQQNQKAKAESDRRTNLNRALDYMANEIRMAKKIESPTVAGEVIKLTLPDNSTVSYSIANSTGVWEGPQSIKRGSDFLVDGMQAPTSASPTCPTPTPAPTPPHQLVGSNGFYACIYSGGKKVDLYLYGKLSDEPRDPDYNKRLEVKSTVYTRANELNP